MAIIVNNVGAGERLMYRVLLVDDEQIERMALAKKIDRYYGDKYISGCEWKRSGCYVQ